MIGVGGEGLVLII